MGSFNNRKKKGPPRTMRDINSNGRLEHITAPDLFEKENIVQVFSAKSGKWIGTIRCGKPHLQEEIEEPGEDLQPPLNPDQLNLFD